MELPVAMAPLPVPEVELSSPLPVPGWLGHSDTKWRRLGEADRRRFSSQTELGLSFALCRALLDSEDEAVLTGLAARIQTGKDSGAARDCKARGNEEFRAGDYGQAAAWYTKGISNASQDSSEISILYANRSAALCHLQHYRDSVGDLENALAHGYPAALEPKLLVRRAECHLHLGDSRRFVSAAAEAERRLSEPGLGGLASAARLRRRLGELRAWEPTGPRRPQEDEEEEEEEEEGRTLLENETLPGASRSVGLRFDATRGRHLVATEDIAAGETVLREEAYAAILLTGGRDTSYCHHCLSRARAPLPCPGCSYAGYCGAPCRREAWAGPHRVECPLGGGLLALGAFARLSLRAVLAAGPEEATARGVEPGEGAEAQGGWRAQPPYRAVRSLLAHARRQPPRHRFLCGLTAAALCSLISAKGLETLVAGDSGGRAMGALGTALLTHMLQLGCNAQAITQLRGTGGGGGGDGGAGGSRVEGREQVRLATAVYATLSLLNHSCKPNTSISFRRRTATVRASQPIQAGHEILHCYGPHWCRLAVSERQRALRAQYFFECECIACSEDQEAAAEGGGEGGAELGQFLCPSCGSALQSREAELSRCWNATCDDQVLPVSFLLRQRAELAGQLSEASGLIDQDQAEEAVRLLLECVRRAEKLLSGHHPLRAQVHDQLARAHATTGNWTAAADHLRRSLASVQARYGASSLESGQELYKLSQILFNGRAVTEALGVIKEAERVLTVHRGPADEMVEELREMRRCLESVLPPQQTTVYPASD